MTETVTATPATQEGSSRPVDPSLQRAVESMSLSGPDFSQHARAFVLQESAQHDDPQAPRLSLFDTATQTTFIPPSQEVYLDSNESASVRFDDLDAYVTLLEAVHTSYQKLSQSRGGGVDTLFAAAINGTNRGQAQYFESIVPSSDARKQRAAMLSDIGEEYSVSDMKGTAMCGERSIVCHNAMKMLGFDSKIKIGTLEARDANGAIVRTEPHAFLLVKKPNGDTYVFDPMNPNLTLSDDRAQVVRSHPNVFRLPEYGQVAVDRTLNIRLQDGAIQKEVIGSNVYNAQFDEPSPAALVLSSQGVNPIQ